MTVRDPDRQALYARLTEVLGADHAITLMQSLPPPDLVAATPADLQAMEERLVAQMEGFAHTLGSRMAGLEDRMDRFEERMDRFEERMDRFDERMDRFEEGMVRFDDRLHGFHFALNAQVRQFIIAQAGMLIALAAVIVATLQLT